MNVRGKAARGYRAGGQRGLRSLAALLLGLVAAGCGGDATSEPESTGGGTESEVMEGTEPDDADADPQETVTLTVADHLPESHVGSVEGARYFMDLVNEKTGDAVEWEYFPTGQLGSAADMLSLVEAGTTDIGLISPTHFDARMPLSGIFALPGLFSSAEEATSSYVSVLNADGSDLRGIDFEENNLVPLVHVVLDPYQITSTDPVQSIEDLSGRLVRSGTAAQEILLNNIGAEPVSITGPETYEALERGTLDATLFPVGTIESYALEEVAPYTTTNAPTGAAILGYSMRRAKFDELSSDIQDALIEAGVEASHHLSQAFDEETSATIDRLSSMEWYEFSDEELTAWEEAAQPVWDEWIEELEDRDLPGQAVLDQLLATME